MQKTLHSAVRIFFILIPVLFSTLELGADGSAEQTRFLNRMIMAYGGVKNVRRLHYRKTAWAVNSPIKPGNNREVRYIKLPQKLRVDGTANHEIRIVDGNRVYRGQLGSEQINAMQGPMVQAARLQLKRLYSPVILLQEKKSLRISKNPKHTTLYYSKNGMLLKFLVNNKSLLIEMVLAVVSTPGGAVEFKTIYEDYRKVEGVYFPYRERKFINGANTANNTLQKIKLDANINDSIFKGAPPPLVMTEELHHVRTVKVN